MRKCNQCAQEKPDDQYYFSEYVGKEKKWKKRYYHRSCKSCENERNKQAKTKRLVEGGITKDAHRKRIERRERKEDMSFVMRHRLSRYKTTDPESDLSVDYLIALWHRQGGSCFYTGLPLDFRTFAGLRYEDTLSLDRLEPEKGYKQGNVVWCKNLCNIMKRDLTYSQFHDIIEVITSRKEVCDEFIHRPAE